MFIKKKIYLKSYIDEKLINFHKVILRVKKKKTYISLVENNIVDLPCDFT